MANVYTLGYTNQARRDLDRLERATARRIEARLRWLAENAQQIRHSPLAGRYQGYYRFRVGNYRAIYDLDRG